jgi:hypothetical protein
MPRAGFEHTNPVFERLKTVRALDRATIETSVIIIHVYLQFNN